MKYYIEAWRHDGTQILGTCDGQNVLRCSAPNHTHAVKYLRGDNRPHYLRVEHWRIVDESGREHFRIINHKTLQRKS